MRIRVKNEAFCAVRALLLLTALTANGQGTFLYDQQSATESSGGGAVATVQTSQPGQSFTPSLSVVGFVRLWLADPALNGLGASVYVNLRSNSITGPIIGFTDPVFLPDGFGAFGSSPYTNFFFSAPARVNPGGTYYFEPVVQSGDAASISTIAYNYNYPGGTAFFGATASPSLDLWFREGQFVPEPSSACLIALAAVALRVFAERQGKDPRESVTEMRPFLPFVLCSY